MLHSTLAVTPALVKSCASGGTNYSLRRLFFNCPFHFTRDCIIDCPTSRLGRDHQCGRAHHLRGTEGAGDRRMSTLLPPSLKCNPSP